MLSILILSVILALPQAENGVPPTKSDSQIAILKYSFSGKSWKNDKPKFSIMKSSNDPKRDRQCGNLIWNSIHKLSGLTEVQLQKKETFVAKAKIINSGTSQIVLFEIQRSGHASVVCGEPGIGVISKNKMEVIHVQVPFAVGS